VTPRIMKTGPEDSKAYFRTKKGTRWRLNTDGAAKGNPGPAGAGWVLFNEETGITLKDGRFLGEATNNEAEYQALLIGLEQSLIHGAKEIVVQMDSELLVRQINGVYKVRNPRLSVFFEKAKDLLRKFSKYDIMHIPREQNREADRMANEAIRRRNQSPHPVS
jgi:ribonuclease HI